MIFEQLCRNCDLYPFTTAVKNVLSEYLGISHRQLNRLISGANVSAPYVRLLEVRAQGIADLAQWKGYTIKGNMLINPSGEYITVEDLHNLNLTKQRFFTLSNQNAYLSHKLLITSRS